MEDTNGEGTEAENADATTETAQAGEDSTPNGAEDAADQALEAAQQSAIDSSSQEPPARASLTGRKSVTISPSVPGEEVVTVAVEVVTTVTGALEEAETRRESMDMAKDVVEQVLERGGIAEPSNEAAARDVVEDALSRGGVGEDIVAVARQAVERAVAVALGEQESFTAGIQESVEKLVTKAMQRASVESSTKTLMDTVVKEVVKEGDIEQLKKEVREERELKEVRDLLLTSLQRSLMKADRRRVEREEEEWRERMLVTEWKPEVDDARIKETRRKRVMGGIHQVPWTPTKRRGPIAAEYQSPGPACVALPNLTGGSVVPDSKRNRAPAFSFGSRHGGKSDSPGPGPGQYNVTGLSAKGKDNPPAASLHSRPKDCKADQTPAPGDYNPEKSEKVVHDNSPKYTFGLKTQHEKPSSTPAPNVYNIPTVLGATKEGNKKQAPAFTISGRQKDKPDDRIYNPGPGSYNDAKADNYKVKSPAYSISSRYQLPSDSTLKPGPGAHSPEKIRSDTIPAHTFGIKHSPYIGVLKAHIS